MAGVDQSFLQFNYPAITGSAGLPQGRKLAGADVYFLPSYPKLQPSLEGR